MLLIKVNNQSQFNLISRTGIAWFNTKAHTTLAFEENKTQIDHTTTEFSKSMTSIGAK